ncbi:MULTISPECIES: alpha/beta hydrolase [unclassified Yoonia]|uniref:alpha/beta hydrolase n=1 Tax=unclassified Yoonia TaxID=2629118 RepID=UPI002AFF9052|nr:MULTISPECIES: alpha/beta hydrolase [unclassified Yoonia]
MALIAVTEDRVPTRQRLARALADLPQGAPVVIMLHGLKYDPDLPLRDPFQQIFALHPASQSKRIVSWPRRLGLRGANALGIGYGWRARGTLWQAHRRAGRTAAPLAHLIRRIKDVDPARPIHLIAHSLGARVALHAVTLLPAASVNRIILITAAAFECELTRAMASPAGQQAEFINIRSRANTLFDILLRLALPHWGKTLGRGRLQARNLLDLCIDNGHSRRVLTKAGFAFAEKTAPICHWSGYLRRDACALYRAMLHRPDTTPLPYLQNLLRKPQAGFFSFPGFSGPRSGISANQ